MSYWKKISTLVCLSMPFICDIHSVVNGTWNVTGGRRWSESDGANWNTAPDAPVNPGDTALLGFSITSNAIVSVDTPVITVASLTFNNNVHSYQVSPTTLGTDFLNLKRFSGAVQGNSFLSVLTGTHSLVTVPAQTPFVNFDATLPDNLSLIVNDPAGELILECNTNNAAASIAFIGPGTTTIRNSVWTSIGGTTVESGTANISNTVPVTSFTGTSLIDSTSLTLYGGTLNITNTADISTTVPFGISTLVTPSIMINGGVLNLNNTGNFANTVTDNFACSLFSLSGANLVIEEGNVFITNGGTIDGTGNIGSGIGTLSTTINGGTVVLQNTGSIIGNDIVGATLTASEFITINGGQIIISNSGTVASGNKGSYVNAPIFVQNGGMVVNDDTVAADTYFLGLQGTYAGIGQMIPRSSSLEFTNSGTVVPGDPGSGGLPGNMTIDGLYTQTSSGTLVINLQNTSSYSQLLVSGSANLNGTLEVADSPGANVDVGDTFIILKANGGVSGQFSTLENFNITGLAPQVQYFPNYVELLFTPITEKYVNLTRPLFSSINETYSRLAKEMGRVRSHFTKQVQPNRKPTKQKFTASLSDVSTQLVAFQSDEFAENNMMVEKASIRPLPFKESNPKELAANIVTEEKKQRLTGSLNKAEERPWNLYVGPKGQVGNVVSREEAQGYSHWSAGAFMGFDYAFSEIGVGLLTEYERIDANVGKDWGEFTVDHLHADAYATYAPSVLPELSLNGILGGSYQWYSIDREIHTTTSRTVKGTPRGAGLDSLFGIEYAFRDSVFSAMPQRLQIIPLASIEYMYLHIDDYKEVGSKKEAMYVEGQNVKSLRSTLGFRINYTWEMQNVTVSPEANFGWQREFLDKDRRVSFTPINFGEFPFTTQLAKSGRNIALAGLDVLVTLYQRHGLEAGYDFEYNSQYHTHFIYMSYNVRF